VREYLEERSADLAVRVERGRRRPAAGPVPGTVYIVGAGPGDPDLLTVRALGLLRAAQVIIHDYLVPGAILSLASPRARLVCFARRGRTAGHGGALRQAAILAAMEEHARAGRSVVRLKSGDPFVFGRGGEEMSWLASRGIPFEIVPGITAALGCAAAARIPLTQRGVSSSVTLVAGHEAGGKNGTAVEWERLPLGGTVAVYMGVGRAAGVVRELLEKAGFPAATPAAAVACGTRPDQQVVSGTLVELPRLLARRGVRSPAVLFVGRSAAFAAQEAAGRESAAQGV